MEILVVFVFASSLFFHTVISATANKTDPIEVEALDAILQHWNVPYKGNNGAQTWNINATNPCKGLIVDESNDERIYDGSSSNRGKLDIRCLCDKDTSLCNIIRLSAWDLHISVTIPNELGKLIKLVYLDLDDNSFQGSIPSSIGNLVNLNTLYLKRNKFEGEIPNSIGNLMELRKLDLSINKFEGEIPNSIGNLMRLRFLYLSKNSLTIGNLVNLTRLGLWTNNLVGEIPNTIWKLTNLNFLDLDDNSFQGSIPSSIGNLVNLNKLDLSRNKFEGEIPNSIGNLTELKNFSLWTNNLFGEIPNTLWKLSNLNFLSLGNNSFQGSIPSYLGDLVNLTRLDLSSNNFTGSIPSNLNERQKQGLLEMSVQGNPHLCLDDLCERSSSNNKTVIIIIAVVCSTIAALVVIIIVVWKVKRSSRNSAYSRTISEERLRHGSLYVATIHAAANKEFTYLELVTMTSNFNRIIGKGGFGNVYHGIDQRNGSQVAVKMLSNSSIQGSKEFQMEAQILTRIHHKNFVSLVGYCTDSDHLALVYEYMEGGNLKNLISGQCSNSTIIGWRDRLRMVLEISQGLDYLHRECQPAIVHRDIKTTNILLTRDFEVKIADFGLSKIFENGANGAMSTIVMGTFGYIDPEYYRTQKLNEKSDVYSLGIVFIELITGQPAVINQEEDRILVATLVEPKLERGEIDQILDPKLNGEYNTNSAKKALEIAFTCIHPTSSERPLMFDVVKQLKECLEIEIPQGSHNTKSSHIDFGSEDVTAPFAR